MYTQIIETASLDFRLYFPDLFSFVPILFILLLYNLNLNKIASHLFCIYIRLLKGEKIFG